MKNIDAKFYASDYYDLNVNKYGVKCGTSLTFWENNGWINKIDPYESILLLKLKLVSTRKRQD